MLPQLRKRIAIEMKSARQEGSPNVPIDLIVLAEVTVAQAIAEPVL
jgi:hypothetical protein